MTHIVYGHYAQQALSVTTVGKQSWHTLSSMTFGPTEVLQSMRYANAILTAKNLFSYLILELQNLMKYVHIFLFFFLLERCLTQYMR